MASSSPSEFLTFYRRAVSNRSFYSAVTTRRAVPRPFSTSVVRPASTGNPNFISDKGTHEDTKQGKKQHVLDKGKDDKNVQTSASLEGRGQRESGGNATRQRDERNSTAKAKNEHPEAPDVVIGMQDERGGKGV